MWKALYSRKEHDEIGQPFLVETTSDPTLLDDAESFTALPAVITRPSSQAGGQEPRTGLLQSAPRKSSATCFHEQGINDKGQVETVEAVRPAATSKSMSRDAKSLFTSHIPTLRGKKSTLLTSSAAKPAVGIPRWDDYSGELTTSATGRPSQVRPSAVTDPFGAAMHNDRYGYRATISGPNKSSKRTALALKGSNIGRESPTAGSRPSWTGRASAKTPASDYETRVPPPVNQYTVRGTPPGRGVINDSDSDRSLTAGVGIPVDEAMIPSSATLDTLHDDITTALAQMSPQTYKSSKSVISAEPSPVDAYPSPISATTPQPTMVRQLTRKPVALSVVKSHKSNQRDSWESVIYTQTMQQNQQQQANTIYDQRTDETSTFDEVATKSLVTLKSGITREPVSRFSWTTVNTSTTYQQDSPPTNPCPVSAMPAVSIMSRRRPVAQQDKCATPHGAGAGSLSIRVQSTPVSLTRPESDSPNAPQQLPTPTSAKSSTSKALPPPPRLSPTMTHMDVLAAQRDNLALQNQNLQRVIGDLQRVDLASPLVVDEKTRKLNRKKLDQYRARLEEVEKEEHDVGRALARARRKVERAEGAGSGLWVRRVTG